MQGKVWYKFYVAIILYTTIMLVSNVFLMFFMVLILPTVCYSVRYFLSVGLAFDVGAFRIIAISLVILIALAIIFLFLKKVFLPVLIVYFLDFILVSLQLSAPECILSLFFYVLAIIIVIIAFIKTRGQKTDKLLKVKTQKAEDGVLPEDMNGNTEDGAQSPEAEIWDF